MKKNNSVVQQNPCEIVKKTSQENLRATDWRNLGFTRIALPRRFYLLLRCTLWHLTITNTFHRAEGHTAQDYIDWLSIHPHSIYPEHYSVVCS